VRLGKWPPQAPKDFLVIHPSDHPSVINELDESAVSKREQPEGDCSLIRMDQLTLMSRPETYLQDLQMMERCLELAQRGAKKGELPFGAVIVSRGHVIAEATNCVSSEGDVTRHAELVALSEAQKVLKRKRLQDCTLYSIMEPCPMCSFPAREARIGRVVFALSSPVMGGYSKWDVLKDDDLSNKLPEVFGPPPEIVSGLLSAQAEQVWRQWNPLVWRFMRRRGCVGSAADLPERHAAAPRPLISWTALAAFLAGPALLVSKAFLHSRAGSRAIPKLDPESDS
jgi:tRNA(adenine34) deaminase